MEDAVLGRLKYQMGVPLVPQNVCLKDQNKKSATKVIRYVVVSSSNLCIHLF